MLVSSAPVSEVGGWEGFGTGNWPSASWRPYGAKSPFNLLTARQAVHPNSSAIVSAALQWGLPAPIIDAAGAANDSARPTYYAQPTDPVFTLRASPTSNSPIQGVRIPIPDAAQPAGGQDAQMTVVTPDGWEYDFWKVQSKPQGGGTLTFARGGRVRIDGEGLGSQGTAPMFGNLAGAIRAQELASGRIRHALVIALRCTGTGTSFGYGVHEGPQPGTGSYVYPARAGSPECSRPSSDLPPLGARFKLAMTGTEIAALPVPRWKKAILTALARFGGYVGASGGPGFSFLSESSTMYTSLGARDPLAEFARRIGAPRRNRQYVFTMAGGVGWARNLRALVPPHEPAEGEQGEKPEEIEKPKEEHEEQEKPKEEEPEGPRTGKGWEGFGGLSLPGPRWRPYAPSSPFNTSTTGATVHPNSQAIVERALSLGLPSKFTAGNSPSSDYSHPTFFAQPSDPLYTLRATESWGPNAIDGMRIPVPEAARPAGGGDGHLAIVTPDGWEYDLWRAQAPPPGGGTLSFAWGGRTRIDGNGLGSAATAADFGNLAGMIRTPELVAGHINHALFIVLKCAASGTSFGYGTTATGYGSSYVYPASHGGSACGSDPSVPPLGARFTLAMSDAQIAALPVPVWKKTILEALAHYGGYVGDTGGPGFAFMVESRLTYTALGLPDPLVALARLNGLPSWNGEYVFDMAGGVEWSKYLRVLTPPH